MTQTGWKPNKTTIRKSDNAANARIVAIWERVQWTREHGCGCSACRGIPATGAGRGTHPMDWMHSEEG